MNEEEKKTNRRIEKLERRITQLEKDNCLTTALQDIRKKRLERGDTEEDGLIYRKEGGV